MATRGEVFRDRQYLVFRSYTWSHLSVYSYKMEELICFFMGCFLSESDEAVFLRHNISKNPEEVLLQKKEVDQFLIKLKKGKVSDFCMYKRLSDKNLGKRLLPSITVCFDSPKSIMAEAFGRVKKDKSNKRLFSIQKIEICIDYELFDRNKFEEFQNLCKQIFTESQSVYGYINLFYADEALFNSRSQKEIELYQGRECGEKYNIHTAGYFWANFLSDKHVEKIKNDLDNLKSRSTKIIWLEQKKCLIQSMDNVELFSEESDESVKRVLYGLLPESNKYERFPVTKSYEFLLTEEQYEKVGGFEIIEKYAPLGISMVKKSNSAAIKAIFEYVTDRDFLIELMRPLLPFRIMLIPGSSGSPNNELYFVYEAKDNPSLFYTIGKDYDVNNNVEFSIYCVEGETTESAVNSMMETISKWVLEYGKANTNLNIAYDGERYTWEIAGKEFEQDKIITFYIRLRSLAKEFKLKLLFCIGKQDAEVIDFLKGTDYNSITAIL